VLTAATAARNEADTADELGAGARSSSGGINYCRNYLQQLLQHMQDSGVDAAPPAVPGAALHVLLRAAAYVLDRPIHVARPGKAVPDMLVFPKYQGGPDLVDIHCSQVASQHAQLIRIAYFPALLLCCFTPLPAVR
jgi:hypothetical protein